ncbi:hypothetical protein EB001_24955, partial [bacterium]|nr:hypothetical protein [bacterium]
EYDFYFRGNTLGIDGVADLVDTAELVGVVERTGAWYLLPDGSKVQGREGFINRVREDLDLQEMIKAKISG